MPVTALHAPTTAIHAATPATVEHLAPAAAAAPAATDAAKNAYAETWATVLGADGDKSRDKDL